MAEQVVEYATYPVTRRTVDVPLTCDLDGSVRDRKAAIEVATAGVGESTVCHADHANLWGDDTTGRVSWRVTVLLCTGVPFEHRSVVQRLLEKAAPWTDRVHVFDHAELWK